MHCPTRESIAVQSRDTLPLLPLVISPPSEVVPTKFHQQQGGRLSKTSLGQLRACGGLRGSLGWSQPAGRQVQPALRKGNVHSDSRWGQFGASLESGWDRLSLPCPAQGAFPGDLLPASPPVSASVPGLYSHACQLAWFSSTPGLVLQGLLLSGESHPSSSLLSVNPLISRAMSNSLSESRVPHLSCAESASSKICILTSSFSIGGLNCSSPNTFFLFLLNSIHQSSLSFITDHLL